MEIIDRHARSVVQELLGVSPVVIIQGARQVGKSTLAHIVSSTNGTPTEYFTLDDEDTRLMFERDTRAVFDTHPDGLIIIDEVQLMPELLRQIKADVDRNRRPGRFLLTGSANVLRIKGEPDSLAGRVMSVHLRGLSQGEYLGVHDDFISAVTAGTVTATSVTTFRSELTRPDYVQQLIRGGFPGIDNLSPRLHRQWLSAYLDSVLQRDSAVLSGGSQTERVQSVARLIAANQSGELVKDHLAENAGIPTSSIQVYIDALHSIYLVDSLRSFRPNLTRREISRRKAYVDDSGLALRLAGVSEAALTDLRSNTIGGFFEAFIASELSKQSLWSATDYNLFHYRNPSGAEVDIICELDDGHIIAFEIKAASTYKKEHFKGLEYLREKLGDTFLAGFVVTMADRGMSAGDRLAGIPANALWAQW